MVKINNFMHYKHYLIKIAFLLGVMLVSVTTSAWGQPAPALRAVVSADAAPEAMSQLFAKLGEGKRTISVPGAAVAAIAVLRGAPRQGRRANDHRCFGRVPNVFAGTDRRLGWVERGV